MNNIKRKRERGKKERHVGRKGKSGKKKEIEIE